MENDLPLLEALTYQLRPNGDRSNAIVPLPIRIL
jgi:hypothetical protein